jgi:mRNA-degrading endonuclease RelE of RelBE toxin-antitoxin system
VRFEIILSPDAVAQLRRLPAHVRATVRDAIELHLRHEPTRLSKSRIKRLRGLDRPQYRLRVEETRVFYDVKARTVEVLAIVSKAEAQAWLNDEGTPSAAGGSGRGEG